MVEPLDSTRPPADADPVVTSDLANWRFQASVIIARPVEEVFEFADKPENEHLWKSGADVEQTSAGASEAGATGRTAGRLLGVEIKGSWEVTEHIPNRKVAFTVNVQGHDFYGLWLFDRVPEGTWMRTISYLPDGPQGLFGKLSDRVVRRIIVNQQKADLRNLKNLLEGVTRRRREIASIARAARSDRVEDRGPSRTHAPLNPTLSGLTWPRWCRSKSPETASRKPHANQLQTLRRCKTLHERDARGVAGGGGSLCVPGRCAAPRSWLDATEDTWPEVVQPPPRSAILATPIR